MIYYKFDFIFMLYNKITKYYDSINECEDLFFQAQMLSGIIYILWDSLAKPEMSAENHARSLAAYSLYSQTEKFLADFRIQIDKLAEQANGRA